MIQELRIEDVFPNPEQPRKFFDELALQELSDSIVADGLQSPILVRPKGNKYEIVQGERRYRAHVLVSLATIRAEVREITDEESFHLSVIENIQREQLTDIEEARAFQRYVEMGYTHEQIASKVSKSRTYITTKLRLLKLIPELQDWIALRKITEGHAKQILKIEALTDRLCGERFYFYGTKSPFQCFQKAFMDEFATADKITVDQVEKWADRVRQNLVLPAIGVLNGQADRVIWKGDRVNTKVRGICEIFDLQVTRLTMDDLAYWRDTYLPLAPTIGLKQWEIHKKYEEMVEKYFVNGKYPTWPEDELFLGREVAMWDENGKRNSELLDSWLNAMHDFHSDNEKCVS